VKVLADLIRKSKRLAAYTGAGISTASGIDDYASSKEGNALGGGGGKPKSFFDARPTLSHYVLADLHHQGHLKHWVQQNHDGLPQKAGYRQNDLNEIHGSWYDPSNPVVMMAGQLRTDLFEQLLEWETNSDLLLVLGTSLSGMNADRMVNSVSKRARAKEALGAVIVSLQRTPSDSKSSLRFFATIDSVMELLAEEMGLSMDPSPQCEMIIPPGRQPEEDLFLVPYDQEGNLMENCQVGEEGDADLSKLMRLDLREDAVLHITTGQFSGDKGVVMSKHPEGHFRIQFRHNIGKGGKKFMAPMLRTLGWWWVDAATRGELPSIPVVSRS
jgi:NAD-dependent SIR2 family protein deacetylase